MYLFIYLFVCLFTHYEWTYRSVLFLWSILILSYNVWGWVFQVDFSLEHPNKSGKECKTWNSSSCSFFPAFCRLVPHNLLALCSWKSSVCFPLGVTDQVQHPRMCVTFLVFFASGLVFCYISVKLIYDTTFKAVVLI